MLHDSFLLTTYGAPSNTYNNNTHGSSPVQKMFRDRTEAMLDRRGPGRWPGPVLTLAAITQEQLIITVTIMTSNVYMCFTEIICPPRPCAASAHSMTALNCGYPTPAFFRVVHTDPGPIPTLIISAPARINSSTISHVTTFPAFSTHEQHVSTAALLLITYLLNYNCASCCRHTQTICHC